MNIYSFFSILLSFILSYYSLPKVMSMLIRSNIVCENFKSDRIPTSMGIVFVFIQVITIGILELLFDFNGNFNTVYLLGFVFMGFIGLIDDLIGEKNIKGLKGHFKALTNGIITTGALKAILGFFISLVVSSFISNTYLDFTINSLLIGLFTNFINLFDLRPGRATKIFIFLFIIFIITSINKDNYYILFSFFGILIPYITFDLKAKAMMGDVGSNILGYTLGIFSTISFNFRIKIVILVLLLIFHFMAERVSFSKIIDNNRFLKYLDSIGR